MCDTVRKLFGHGARMARLTTLKIDTTISIRHIMNVNGSANGAPRRMPIKPVLQSTTKMAGVQATNISCGASRMGLADIQGVEEEDGGQRGKQRR